MPVSNISDQIEWKDLEQHAVEMQADPKHLRHLLKDPGRLASFSLSGGGLFLDYSRQRVEEQTLVLLHRLAARADVREQFKSMASGAKVNVTENRAALHTAARKFDDDAVVVDGADIMPAIRRVRDDVRAFAHRIHSGDITGSTGKRFRHVVVIGIGGSYLGTEFVATALAAYADKDIQLHFLANVDIHNLGYITARIDPAATLWIVISKSYTTAETMANAAQVSDYLSRHSLDPAQHMVAVTSEGSPGDRPDQGLLQAFHMFDFIGGRYSVTSAVGGVPLSLYLGYDRFEAFLTGAAEMDRHAEDAEPAKNLPLTAALIDIWNNNFLNYAARAIIPYATPMSKLAPHVQQLNMESNGKAVTRRGEPLPADTGVIIFGEPGTNAQHSFFQLAHQGRPFPIDFIGVLKPQYTGFDHLSKGVTNHQELWANLLSQPMALAVGRDHRDPARRFQGNRPSSTLVLEDLTPKTIGRLLAFYEARTVFEAFVWGINPFDQFGVELGKVQADTIRSAIAARNRGDDQSAAQDSPIVQFYLEALFNGRIE
jgi:glucose-6-phosphate isomerase